MHPVIGVYRAALITGTRWKQLYSKGSPILIPDIVLRIQEVRASEEHAPPKPEEKTPRGVPCTETLDMSVPLRIKEEESVYPIALPITLPVMKDPIPKSPKGLPESGPDLIVVVKTEEELLDQNLRNLEEGTGSSVAARSLLPPPQTSSAKQASIAEKFKQKTKLVTSASSLSEQLPIYPRRILTFTTSGPAFKRRRMERPILPRITTVEAQITPKKEEATAALAMEESPQRQQRHAEIRASEIDILEIERNEKKTRQQTNWAVNVFKSWLKEQFKPEAFEHLSKGDLALILREFYATVRTTDSQQYSVSSYVCMRAGINRHINDPPYSRNFNIMRDSEFNSANNVFLATLKKLKKEGKDAAESHPAISPIDMQKLKNSKVLNTSTPEGLIRTVWFNIQIHFARRGRKGQRELPANAFKIMTDPQGFKYATLAFDEKTKSLADPREYRGIMYASGRKEQCPVLALEKYLSKLPPNPSSFYLKAKRIPSYLLDSTPIWYENRPLGKNTLGGMMSALSKEANLSRIYTNHSIRATSIQILSDAGLETREIMTLTGHKKDSSVRAYWAPTETQRKTWSHLLTLAGTTAENSETIGMPSTSGNELRLPNFVHCRILGTV
ncbi:uncharacterized protein KIAA1958-like isoform X2 [Ambystoma mexicanum]|uniref:uncharacterized protein KIAA1958-like isoform X2 n=1 Tax=Ambystoma mexicanum TaxID=8296 RepID=UPI0037E99285